MTETRDSYRDQSTESPRIWVGSLADYNAGRLVGEWIELDEHSEPEQVEEEIQERVLGKSLEPIAEEWGIFDYEGFCSIRIGEYESLERVCKFARALSKYGESFSAYCGLVGESYATEEEYLEAYVGEYESPEDYAYEWLEELGIVRELDAIATGLGSLSSYIDLERVARDMDYSGMSFVRVDSETCYVFNA